MLTGPVRASSWTTIPLATVGDPGEMERVARSACATVTQRWDADPDNAGRVPGPIQLRLERGDAAFFDPRFGPVVLFAEIREQM